MVTMLTLGALLAIVSGVMNGTFTLPMRYLGKWEWENVWILFIVTSCWMLPLTVAAFTVSAPGAILAAAPTQAVFAALAGGGIWGFGAIMFGQSVSALGISLANTIVLAVSASLGSLLPMAILDPAGFHSGKGRIVLVGTAVAIVGMVLSGIAGRMRENSRMLQQKDAVSEELVGHRRPIGVAVLLCLGSGFLSAIFNIGFSFAQPIITVAKHAGLSAAAGTNLVWVLMLGAGSIVNLLFCAYLLVRNHSFSKFKLSHGRRLYLLALLMGLLWGGSIFLYGEAATRLGAMGPAIGWPLSLATGLLVANVCGIWAGEWRETSRATKSWMASGLLVLFVAVLVLGRAGAQ